MVNDPESQLYRDMARLKEQIPKLQEEIRSLKTRLGKLASRVEQLERMGFQEQLIAFGDELKQLKATHDEAAAEQKEAVLQTQRFLADFVIVETQNYSTDMMGKINLANAHSIFPTFVQETAIARGDVDRSDEPLSIAAEF